MFIGLQFICKTKLSEKGVKPHSQIVVGIFSHSNKTVLADIECLFAYFVVHGYKGTGKKDTHG